MQVVVLSHGEMPGYMRAMTMGFRAASPKLYEGLRVAITAMEKISPDESPETR